MEDEERQKKLEAGKAKLAQFRQRKAQSDGQSASKKQKKKKKASNTKDEESIQDGPDIDRSQGDETSTHQRGAAATAEFVMRTLRSREIIKHDQTYAIEPDSEISTTADDYSSEVNGCSFVTRTAIPADLIREEEFGVGETYSEHEMQHSQTRLEMMENELAGKQQEIEELNRELEEMRAAYGTEGLQQLQEFEAAIKQRDDIITQLTTNLQQARKEKDETLREFLELTEQSQKLQIQFQHLQASEALRNTSHSSTAADLLQAKQQILTHQQQLEEQEYLLKNYQKKNKEFEVQIALLQDRITVYEMEKHKNEREDSNKKLQEKEILIGELKAKIIEEEKNAFQVKEKLSDANKSLEELKEQIVQKNQEANDVRLQLANCKQKERQCSDEIKQLMGTVEELQKRCHKDSQFETDIVQRMELETQRRLAQLQAELDEMYGQQIVQMKQELIKQHALEIEELLAQQKIELEKTLNPCSSDNINEDQVRLMNIAINDLNMKLQDANYQKEKIKQDLSKQLEGISAEKSIQQTQIEDLFQELTFAREQIQRAKQTIMDKECRLNEADKYQVMIEELKAQLASASELRKELELKHEAEVTNYKIKLEMLEREKDEVLDRMAESQESELERLRTQLLFSHEEELSNLREDLQQEHRINIEILKDNLATHYKQQLEGVQNEMSQKIEAMEFEKDNLITKQSQLLLEISKLKDLQQSVVNSKSEEMTLQIQELQKEIDVLRQEEKEEGILEQEVQELQLKTELLEKQMKEKEVSHQEKCKDLETQNNLLKDENRALEEKLKHILVSSEEKLIFTDNVYSKSEDLDMQNRIEKLMAENAQFIKQDLELKAEIERQKNTFSFAEKNFEASYQELQEEYACLLKIKADLEESKNKEEAEYKTKLKVLTEELQHLQSYELVVLKTKSSVFEGSKEDKICRAETFEVGEVVVEKDTTELMEKLEVAQREKVELSLRLSDLSEQLKLKHSEICQLSEEVKSLKLEKEQVLARCKEQEIIISHNQAENVNICEQKTKYSKEKDQADAIPVSETRNLIFDPSNELGEEIKVREDNLSLGKDTDHHVTEKKIQQMLNPEQQSLLDHVHQMTDRLAGETSLLAITQHENDQLQQQLDILKSEQTDLRLQMEAQRICLSLVYSAHVEQVLGYLKAEKENALCSLKEELICSHAQEMNELKKMYQLELQTLKGQQADDEGKSTVVLIEKLSKAVSEECFRLTQLLCSVQSEQHSTPIKVSPGEQDIFHVPTVERKEPDIELPTHRIQAQALQESMQILLSKIMEEYNRLMALHTQFMRDFKKVEEQQTSYVELEHRKEEESNCLQMKIEDFQTPSQDLIDLMVRASHWEEMENLKTQLEGQHAQEIEHLRSYFQQQLKETDERYTTEIVHLQNRLQDVSESPEDFSISEESQENSKDFMQKMTKTESLYQQSTDTAAEFPSEMESKGDKDIIQLLEKQYQGRLEEEIAKVIVSMSVAFAQQTELARMARQEEESALLVAQTKIVHKKEECFESRKKCTEHELDNHLIKEKKADIKHTEEFKPLSKELSEESSEISSLEEQLESRVKPGYILELSKNEMRFPVKVVKEISPYHEMATSSTETSGQLLLYEERLEDMRQELVRQYQEHQQATELLRQGHMQQMEWQKENQEQLLAELDRLKVQLAESVSVENDNLVTERERMLLEELELLKQYSVPGREKLHCELCNNSTQTQDENERQTESKEYTFEGEDRGGKPEEISSDILSKERHTLQKANNRLLKILLEVVKTTVAVEETIGLHVLGLLDRPGKDPPSSKTVLWESEAEQSVKPCVHMGFEKEEPSSLYHSTDLGDDATIRWAEVTDEGLQLTQHLTGSGFAGEEINPDNEELVLNISSRLQAAVEKLLEAINETSNQPVQNSYVTEEKRATATSFGMDSYRTYWASNLFNHLRSEGQEDTYEVESRVPLPNPFPFTEHLDENNSVVVNTSIFHYRHKKNGHILKVVSKISLPTPPYSLEHAKVSQTELMRESFKKQQEATEFFKCQEELQERLSEEVKAREQLALELSKAEGLIDGYADERAFLEKQILEKTDIIDHLEQELLCTGNKLQELEAERQQIQEEKELLSRQKDAMKADARPVEQQLLEETEKLMKEKIEVQRQAEKEYDDLQKQVKALETDVEEQVNRFIELEQEKNAELTDLRQQNQALEKQLEKTRKFLDEQAIDREHERDVFQQEIQKLEQQLKTPQRFQPINEHQTGEVEQLTNHLQEKTDKCSELLLSKEQLQRDIQERNEEIEKLEWRIRELEQALIISADNLQKVEERKQCGAATVKGELPLEVQLQAEQEAVDRKEKEITNLEEQLEQFREELENKNEEVQQLHMQLEIQRKESTTRFQELEQENKLFKDEMERLGLVIQKSEDASIKDHCLVPGKLAQIMHEKEQEIDHLNEQITTLQQQLEITTDNKVIEEKNEHIRELEAQIECLKSDQERVKKNSEEEIEQLNEVIEKLQQELSNIEQKVPVDVASIQEDADSLKHELDTVLAEKEALKKQVEDNNVESSMTKNELEETKLKMNHLKKELDILKRELEKVTEKYKHLLMKSDKAEEQRRNEKSPELLENKIQLKSVEENTKITISNMEIKLQQLQAAIKERESELCLCYKQIKDLNEQSKVETEVLKKKILELEEILQEKVAAALVSQVQLNAIQEQNKLSQRMQAFSKGAEEANKNTQTENVNHIAKEETESKLSVLTEKLSEMENQLAKMYNNLELEKENAEIAQKEAIKKENRLLELQQLLEDIQENHKEEIKKTPKQGEVQTSEVITELTQSQEGSVFIAESELEKIKAESAAAKEELSSYREKSEKLQEELMVRETSTRHLQEELHRVKDNLVEAEKKLADYMREEEEIAELESRKDVDKPDNVSTKEDPTSTRKSSSSQTEKTIQINSSNQTLQVLVKNAEIQNDLQNEYSSEEVAEVIREFTEKIDQMQELHAAEIMDMETRHISESEALKREQLVAVQVLTEECNALKEVIETLRANEAVPISGLPHTASYMARDGCSSDSSSDWSQGIYLAQSQGSDIVSEGIGEEDETSTDLLPKKIKGLLRAVHHEGVQVLSLTEFPDSERDILSLKQGPESWLEERKTFLSTVSSLKDLITQMQLHRETEICANCEPPESVPDWRGELLHAVQQVFLREQDVFLAASQTDFSELGTKDAVVLMNQLEHRLQEQVISQRMAMDFIQNADRRSLLMEIQVLRTQMNNRKVNPEREQEIDPKSQEMLEYNMQQKQSQILEMQVELHSVKDRAAELQEQLNSERMMVSEVKNELAQAKLELETTLKAQHKHFKDLEIIRTEVKEKAAELDMLKDTMANEQKKSRELQWALEKEKAKMERDEERGREEFEDLKISLEDQKQKNLQLNKLLEQEKQLSSDLQQKIESQEVLNAAQLSHERGRNSELQVLLESEKVRALEMRSALEREKELCAQLQSVEDKGQDGTPKPTEELLKDLQKQMDEKHDRIVQLVSETERYKLDSIQMRQQMEKERQIQRKTLQTEQDANILAQKKVHELESKVEDLDWQLEEKRQQVHKLEHEVKKLQEIIQELQKKEQEREEKKEAERAMCQNLNETTWDTSNERTRNWVLQQKMEGAETNDSTYPALTEMKGEADLNEGSKVLENIRQKLQNVSSKLKQLAHKAASRLQFETADDDNFIGVQSNIEDVLLLLGTLPGLSQLEGLKLVLPPAAAASSLTEKLLRQNAELTGLVSRLSEEKNNLRNAALKLEEELRRYRQRGLCGDYSSRHSLDNGANIDTLIVSEKEIWNREKLSLQKSLKQADAELSKLRAELRSEAFLRELGSNSENAVLKIIYGKYLRAESFRKALIYQKKYLLLLVGGFQECEEATLALIARMGGQPLYTDLEIITHRSKGFTRFRSVVRVSIAISRMKFLVRRWHRVTGSNLISVNRDGFSQNTGNELRPDSLAGGLEFYGEQRHSSDRSRSELESLRSPINSQHRFQGIHVDLSPASLACSQLQNYDPDRALTDYINRLEALQRRLGSVQSGSTSYTHLHSGVRR
ncbi:A-kinase anchor protein 9 isoform X20 [Dermochelys coriacea]|uniref:A-kinase anchor protein 9 isoform X20 n=1 Tax=Dermochelys coriacea TaxID=27794 RepID=UPI001CAA069A|nr:A-kinase anchor protein 9 isoform X20 [Dermochelys coriacea]